MSGTILIASIGVVSLIVVLLFFKLGENPDKNHYILQILFLGFIVGLIFLLGKSAIDYKDNCSWLVNSSSTTGSTTTYSYSYNCSTNTNNTANVFFEACNWIFRVTIAYILIYWFVEIWKYFTVKRGED